MRRSAIADLAAIEPKVRLEVDKAKQRSLQEMKKDAAKAAPAFRVPPEQEASPAPAGLRGGAARPTAVKRFLPTYGTAEYARMKTEKRAKAVGAQREARAPAAAGAVTREARLAPITGIGVNVDGAMDVDGGIPPDTHGAVGLEHFVETTNSHIDIFEKANPANRTSLPYAAFFGYSDQTLFDARVVFDSDRQRWVVTAEAFAESPTVQRHFIAVSQGPDPLGSYFIYNLNVDFFGNGNFFDFPQLGLDAESVIITANIFQGNNLLGADMFAIPKSSLYQGLGFSVPVFVGLQATLAPPIVLDQNPTSFLIAAPGGNTLKMYALQNSGSPTISLTGPVDISVPAYAVPPPAPQPGTSQVLDTSDARFVNASTQVGDLLWQVHSIDVANLPTPRWYRISTPAASVLDSGLVFASQTSSDFNASIAANADSDVFLTWTSVDAAGGINPQVRFAGCDHNDPGCVLGAGTDAFTSPSFFSDDRWGDYSAVTIDPTNPHRAWLVNETAQLNHDWSSRIVEIGF